MVVGDASGVDEFVARTQDLGGAVRHVVPAGVHGALDAGPRLAKLAALVDAGQLTPRVAATLPLEQVAHQRVAAGGLRGRIVLTLGG